MYSTRSSGTITILKLCIQNTYYPRKSKGIGLWRAETLLQNNAAHKLHNECMTVTARRIWHVFLALPYLAFRTHSTATLTPSKPAHLPLYFSRQPLWQSARRRLHLQIIFWFSAHSENQLFATLEESSVGDLPTRSLRSCRRTYPCQLAQIYRTKSRLGADFKLPVFCRLESMMHTHEWCPKCHSLKAWGRSASVPIISDNLPLCQVLENVL